MRKRLSLNKLSSEENSSAAPTFGRDPTLPVFLNHFYTVLDSATFKAIEHDVFLREHFAINEQRTTVRADQTYTGLYFYGTNTYFEFFDVTNSPRPNVGDSGIAFGVDQPGDVSVLQERLGPNLTDVKLIDRWFQGKPVPWFFMASPQGIPFESDMSAWVMEYHPEFLARWNSQVTETNQGIRRSDILKRYSEVLDPINEPILKDVIGLTVATDARTTARLIEFCLQTDYRLERKYDGAVTLRGPDFVLSLIAQTETDRGIREIKMSWGKTPERDLERHFGQSSLKFSGRSAIWSFR